MTEVPEYVRNDAALTPYVETICRRLRYAEDVRRRLGGLHDAASQYLRFGLHRTDRGWTLREWAPNATAIHLRGPFSGWRSDDRFALQPTQNPAIWELHLDAEHLQHGDRYHLHLQWPGGVGKRIPTYAQRVIQIPNTAEFDAEVWDPPTPYAWRHATPPRPDVPLIYEAHPGIATSEDRVGTWSEFRENVLPRVVAAGYNTVQLMAVAEHPYYGSFGYHVTSFFAPSSRYGTPDDLRELVDAAHGMGLRVVFDLVHSHTAKNEVEGLARFDGTEDQYFHAGPRGYHDAWDTRCFDYGKPGVLRFLLSNVRYWLDEFRCDGFRFDGVTSMLYDHHGLYRDFGAYEDYFSRSVDEDALAYLTLANRLVHDLRPDAITIAEDMSGMPGLAIPGEAGGYGFDYRLGMGIPDYWIELIKERRDEEWPVGELFHRIGNRRHEEPTIAYSESHDQAIVGDQTLIFRLLGTEMYTGMSVFTENHLIDRGIALSKLIRLITVLVGGEGYLNFIGNEFGHPDWIDFPREGNNWSYEHAKRLWHLADDGTLRYRLLAAFDRQLLEVACDHGAFTSTPATLLRDHTDHQLLTFFRGSLFALVNLHPTRVADAPFELPPGKYEVVLDTDLVEFGGKRDQQRRGPVATTATTREEHVYHEVSLPLQPRTGVVLRRL
ncbi:MAG: alpha-amylase family glycosyl hydrolase [Planctomycetota bacterium]